MPKIQTDYSNTIIYKICCKDVSINDIYVITTDGDRYDKLALQYYNDSTLWWVISIGNNNLPQNTLNVPIGLQIRIPRDVSNIIVAYDKLNS